MIGEHVNDFWEIVVETMEEGLMIVNPSGIIVSVNKAFEEMVKYSREELIGKRCNVLNCDICMGVLTNIDGHWCELFRSRKVKRKKCILTRKDGSRLHVLKNASLLYDEEGNVLGAVETLTDLSEVLKKERQIEEFRKQLRGENGFCGIVGGSPIMQRLFQLIENASKSDAPVIIYGESGTGKELVAQAIHKLGSRSNGPFVKVNCAALSETLFESELFGHVKGAFTGAHQNRKGRFEMAHHGDIFLDEIGDLPELMQVKLLRVLEEKEIERVGDSRPIKVDVRIISATNKDLKKMVEEGRFRKDFYYRINVIPIFVPPLRERREDLPLLVEHFISRNRLKTAKEIKGVSREVMELFYDYPWPGNVRELRSVIEYAFVVCDGPLIQREHLIPSMKTSPPFSSLDKPTTSDFLKTKELQEKEQLITALKEAGGSRTKAAKLLGVSRVTVWKRMKKYGLL